MTKKPNVIEFPKSEFENRMTEALSDFKAGKIKNFVMGYTILDEESKDQRNKFSTYWFGDDTCLYISGLIRRLDQMVTDFAKENEY